MCKVDLRLARHASIIWQLAQIWNSDIHCSLSRQLKYAVTYQVTVESFSSNMKNEIGIIWSKSVNVIIIWRVTPSLIEFSRIILKHLSMGYSMSSIVNENYSSWKWCQFIRQMMYTLSFQCPTRKQLRCSCCAESYPIGGRGWKWMTATIQRKKKNKTRCAIGSTSKSITQKI